MFFSRPTPPAHPHRLILGGCRRCRGTLSLEQHITSADEPILPHSYVCMNCGWETDYAQAQAQARAQAHGAQRSP